MFTEATPCAVFCGSHRVAHGPYAEVVSCLEDSSDAVIYNDLTGEAFETAAAAAVSERAVALMPLHWDYLDAQPGGASVALRQLVDQAVHRPRRLSHQSRDAAFRFLYGIAAGRPDLDAITSALLSNDQAEFERLTGALPADVAAHARYLARAAFAPPDELSSQEVS